MQQTVIFPSGSVEYLFRSSFAAVWQHTAMAQAVIVTDEHIAALYPQLFAGIRHIVLPAGEDTKHIDTIGQLTAQLLQMEATRNTMLVGVGGGVVTDITGFLASVYMRGVRFGLVPTTLLAMADAAIGGKNGVNVGLHKNVMGTITQPAFLLYDAAFLHTLPDAEWSNGFAEIIKYACIFDASLFEELAEHDLHWYKNNKAALEALTERCAGWKNRTVMADEQEKGVRKLLNFGHTAAHAIENLYGLPHGRAVAIGMVIAARLSEQVCGLPPTTTQRLRQLLLQYGLPVSMHMDVKAVMDVLRMDKKRKDDCIDYILMLQTGEACIRPLAPAVIEKALYTYESHN